MFLNLFVDVRKMVYDFITHETNLKHVEIISKYVLFHFLLNGHTGCKSSIVRIKFILKRTTGQSKGLYSRR